MFLGLALLLFGLAWMLRALGVYSAGTFGLVGSTLIVFAGLLKLLNLKRGRKFDDHF